jgi:hypothetical protein
MAGTRNTNLQALAIFCKGPNIVLRVSVVSVLYKSQFHGCFDAFSECLVPLTEEMEADLAENAPGSHNRLT